MDLELADAAAHSRGRRGVITYQVVALFLREIASWPPA